MVEQVDTQHLKCCGLTSVRVRFPLRLLNKPSNLFRGFFGFMSIYYYIRSMKNPFENLSEDEIKRLMFTTDLPMLERNKEIFNKYISVKETGNQKSSS